MLQKHHATAFSGRLWGPKRQGRGSAEGVGTVHSRLVAGPDFCFDFSFFVLILCFT
jgi:hypothetical protein